jgi:hypothetical protein
MLFLTAMLAQVSPSKAVYHNPQLTVVPGATTVPAAGATFSSWYPSDVPGTIVEFVRVDTGGTKVPP